MSTSPLLFASELRVLRAVDERPGVVAFVIAHATGQLDETVVQTLERLERLDLVRSTRIVRTGAVSWRITRAGVEQLIATPAPRLRRGRARGGDQLDISAVPGVAR